MQKKGLFAFLNINGADHGTSLFRNHALRDVFDEMMYAILAASILIPEGMKGINDMKRMQKAAAILWFAGLLCLLSAILTNWNDKVFLPLALTFIMAANYSGIACEKLKQEKR